MIPIIIEGATRRLGPPPGISKDDCHDLSIRDEPHDVFGREQWSAWEPTPKEISMIVGGAKVYLGIAGHSFPPVRFAIGHYFGEKPDCLYEPRLDLMCEVLLKPDVAEARDIADRVDMDFKGAPERYRDTARALASIIDAQADMIEKQHELIDQLIGEQK